MLGILGICAQYFSRKLSLDEKPVTFDGVGLGLSDMKSWLKMLSQCAGNLIPARFLILLAHLTVCIITLCSMSENVYACLSDEHEPKDYSRKEFQFQLGLYLGLALIAVELLGFLSGTSMFLPSVASLSIGCHSSASVLMAQSLMDGWSCHAYWWIFSFCSVVPAALEVAVAFKVHILKHTCV